MRKELLGLIVLASLVAVGCNPNGPAEGPPTEPPKPMTAAEKEDRLSQIPPEARESARRAMENQGGGYTGPPPGKK